MEKRVKARTGCLARRGLHAGDKISRTPKFLSVYNPPFFYLTVHTHYI
jgi:hypothetical protein